jgi:hypothetical protein
MSDAGPAQELPIAQPSVPCRHLRNKGMYIYTDGEHDTGHEGYDNTIYWCLKTMKDYGPDDQPVDGPDCRNCERSCYEAF